MLGENNKEQQGQTVNVQELTIVVHECWSSVTGEQKNKQQGWRVNVQAQTIVLHECSCTVLRSGVVFYVHAKRAATGGAAITTHPPGRQAGLNRRGRGGVSLSLLNLLERKVTRVTKAV